MAGHASREPERHDRQRGHARGAFGGETFANAKPQVIDGAVGRINDMRGGEPKRAEQFPLPRDAVGRRAIERERMAAARFRKAAFQFVACAVEEPVADIPSVYYAQAIKSAADRRPLKVARA